jgi:hypothetical protein
MIIIGDSHSVMFEEQGIHCGPRTAYRLYRNKNAFLDLIKHLKNTDEKIGTLFGEIDCRIHIWYQSKKKKINVFHLISNTVGFYIEFLNYLRKEGYNIHFILEIPPAAEENNIYKYEYYADYFNRQLITHHFNRKLEEHANNNGYFFIKYSNMVTDSNYRIKREYLMTDGVHLKPIVKPFIMNEIYKIINLEHPNRKVIDGSK